MDRAEWLGAPGLYCLLAIFSANLTTKSAWEREVVHLLSDSHRIGRLSDRSANLPVVSHYRFTHTLNSRRTTPRDSKELTTLDFHRTGRATGSIWVIEHTAMRRILTLLLLTMNFLGYSQTNCATKIDSLTNREIYFMADELPKYYPNQDSLFKFIINNFTYPKECIEVSVFVGFIVEPTGELTGKRIVKGAHPNVNKNVLDLIDEMPNWTPAICNDQKIPFLYVLPLRIRPTLD